MIAGIACALAAPLLEPGAPVVTGSSRAIGLAGTSGAAPSDVTSFWRNPASLAEGWTGLTARAEPGDPWALTFRFTGWGGVTLRQMGPPGIDDPGIRTTQGQHLVQMLHAGLALRHADRDGLAIGAFARYGSTLRDTGVPRPHRRRVDMLEVSLAVGGTGRLAWGAGPVAHLDRLCGVTDLGAEPVVCGPERARGVGFGLRGGARFESADRRMSVGLGADTGSVPLRSDGDVVFVKGASIDVGAALALNDVGVRPGVGDGRALQVLASVRATAPTGACALDEIGADGALDCARGLPGTLQPALALEGEPVEGVLRVRGGAYVEPGRARTVGPRPHLTVGADLRLPSALHVGPFTSVTFAVDHGPRVRRAEGIYLHGVFSPTLAW